MPNLLSPAVDKLAFRPPRPSYRKEDVTLWIETDRGSWIPAIHLNRGFKFTLLISHGNAEDMGDSARLWQVLSEILRVNVFCYEYSGYGHATGKPSEENLYSDARAAVHLLVNELGLKASSEIVLVGKSLGSCAVCHLASRGTTYRGMILVAGMASGARVLFPNAGGALLDGAAFNNLAKLKKSTTPVQAANALYRVLPAPPPTAQQAIPPQIIHGLEDSMIHPSCAREVHRACNAFHPLPPAFIPSGGHELERTHSKRVLQVTADFLQYVDRLGEGSAWQDMAELALVSGSGLVEAFRNLFDGRKDPESFTAEERKGGARDGDSQTRSDVWERSHSASELLTKPSVQVPPASAAPPSEARCRTLSCRSVNARPVERAKSFEAGISPRTGNGSKVRPPAAHRTRVRSVHSLSSRAEQGACPTRPANDAPFTIPMTPTPHAILQTITRQNSFMRKASRAMSWDRSPGAGGAKDARAKQGQPTLRTALGLSRSKSDGVAGSPLQIRRLSFGRSGGKRILAGGVGTSRTGANTVDRIVGTAGVATGAANGTSQRHEGSAGFKAPAGRAAEAERPDTFLSGMRRSLSWQFTKRNPRNGGQWA